MKRNHSFLRLVFFITVLAVGSIGATFAQQDKPVPTSEKLIEGKKKLSNIKRIHRWLIKKLQEARSAQDLPATDCLGEKLTAIKALLFLAERANLNLQEAAAKNNTESVNFNFLRIDQSDARARDIEVEAKLCRGKAGIYTGKTKVTVTGPADGDTDPTLPPWKEPVIVRLNDTSKFY